MRIMHLSWEYPPVVYGGLGRHVHAMAEAQAANGHDVTVITSAASALSRTIEVTGSSQSVVNGVRVIRVEPDPPRLPFEHPNLLSWVAGMEHGFVRAGIELFRQWQPEVIHGHDWMIGHAGVALRDLARVPLAITIHATEAGRHQGWVSNQLSAAIHATEWWLTHSADQVIACSQHMREEIGTLFSIPANAVSVIPNGIDAAAWRRPNKAAEVARERYAGDGPLLVYSGRVEWEKGVQTLIAAMPRIRRAIPEVRLVVAGTGTHLEALRAQARRLRLARAVTFTGWLEEADLHALVAAADLAIVPSIYEPFGLVALEAAALRTPVIVARTGGLAEFAADGQHAATFGPADPKSLASAVIGALGEPRELAARAKRASGALRELYSWPDLAQRTVAAYQDAAIAHAVEEVERASVLTPVFTSPLGNLLTGEPPTP